MAKEIITQSWCDIELEESDGTVRRPGQTYEISFGSPPREIELCEQHAKELYEPLKDAWERLASPVREASPAKTTRSKAGMVHTCPFCQSNYAHRSSLRSHVEIVHPDQWTAWYLENYGRDANLMSPCPECGRKYRPGQGMGQHLARMHGIKGNAQVFLDSRKPDA